MSLTRKVLHQFFNITGIIIGIATLIITVVWAIANGNILGEVTDCATIDCLIWFGIKAVFGIVVGLWIVILVITSSVDLISSGISNRSRNISIKREQVKKMTLTAEPLEVNTGKLDLRIHNNEDSFVSLREAVVFDQQARYRVSVEPEVRVEAHKSRTTRFLTEDNTSKSLQYYIRGHHSNGTTTDALYGQGIREFQVAVTYDSDEKRSQGTIKRFLVTVDYKAEHVFDLKIQDAD